VLVWLKLLEGVVGKCRFYTYIGIFTFAGAVVAIVPDIKASLRSTDRDRARIDSAGSGGGRYF